MCRGQKNVLAESILLSMSHNINKLHNKIQSNRTGKHLFELNVGVNIYFTYYGATTLGAQLNLKCKYDTTEIFYLQASNSSNQDLIGLETKNNEETLTLTIQENKLTSIKVTKEWIGPAAKSITVNLLSDGKKVDTQVLNEKNNWQYTFTSLEKYKDGQ